MKSLIQKHAVTHRFAHIDEFLAYFVLAQLGTLIGYYVRGLKFIGEGVIETLDPDAVYLGVAGNHTHPDVFDEHSYNGESNSIKKKKDSAVMMVARRLGILGKPEYASIERLIMYAHHNDTNGSKNMMELGNLITLRYRDGWTEDQVWAWLEPIFRNSLHAFDRGSEKHRAVLDITRGKTFVPSAIDAVLSKFKPEKMTCKRFVLRNSFCLRDVVAVKIAKKFSRKIIRCQNTTRVDFVDPYDYTPQKGDVCIGFGDGPFGSLPAKKMAKLVKLRKGGQLSLVMKYVDNLNSRSGYHPFELAGLLVDLRLNRKDNRVSHWDMFRWATVDVDLLIRKQKRFLDAGDEFHNGFKSNPAKTRIFKRTGTIAGTTVTKKIVVVESDHLGISNYAFSKRGFECDIVICKNSKGHIAVQTRFSRGRRMDISTAVGKLRFAEMRARGIDTKTIDKRLFYEEGSMMECLAWYYHKDVEAVFSGSPTHPDVTLSKLSLDRIANIFLRVLEKHLGTSAQNVKTKYKNSKSKKA